MAILKNESRAQYTVVLQSVIRDENLSLKALGLLVKLLSMPDNWHFSEQGLLSIFKNDGQSSVRSGLKELEQFGYLVRKRTRNEKGQVANVDWTIRETPLLPTKNDGAPPPHLENPITDNPHLVSPNLVSPNLEINLQSITKESKTKKSITKSINQSKELMDRIDGFRELIKKNISYDSLRGDWLCGQDELTEMVEIMTEAVVSTGDTVRVGGEDKPTAVVAERLLKLDSRHIAYVMDCMNQNTKPIKNIRAYLLTALYNAPTTMSSHYKAEVQSDLFGGDGHA